MKTLLTTHCVIDKQNGKEGRKREERERKEERGRREERKEEGWMHSHGNEFKNTVPNNILSDSASALR